LKNQNGFPFVSKHTKTYLLPMLVRGVAKAQLHCSSTGIRGGHAWVIALGVCNIIPELGNQSTTPLPKT
jgi:hypothetical protein